MCIAYLRVKQPQPNPVTIDLTSANNSAVAVTNGVFSVQLDFGANAFTDAARYLEISVRHNNGEAFTILSPRQQITSTPHAIQSLNAATAITATTAASFSGPLAGDVTGTQAATVVSNVGGQSAANIASAITVVNGATSTDTPDAIVLRGVLSLPISTWNYKSQAASVRHIGPMAQDFFSTFKVGEGDKTIATIDPDGVALAAIQGLNEELKDRDVRIDGLQQQVKQQQEQIDGLRKLLCLDHPNAAVCKESK